MSVESRDPYPFPDTIQIIWSRQKLNEHIYINRLFAYCKGSNFNIIFIIRRGSAISSAKEETSGSIHNLVKSK